MRREHPSLTLGLVGAWCPSLNGIGVALQDFSPQRNHAFFSGVSPLSSFLVASGGGLAISPGVGGAVVSSLVPRLGFTASLQFPGTVTMSAWVRPASLLGAQIILALDNGSTREFGFFTQDDKIGVYALVAANGIAYSASCLNQGAWQHVCVVANQSAVVFFRNGVSVGTATLGSLFTASQRAHIGSRAIAGDELRFSGQIDDVRLYGRALTVAEVRLLSSRRGVGLASQRQRRANVLGSRFSVNVAGTWRDAVPSVNVAGVWKQATPSTRAGGVWK